MKKALLLLPFTFYLFTSSIAQTLQTPDKIYGRLFIDVQMNRIFPDNKIFLDCVPKRDPKEIVSEYLKTVNNPAIRFSLRRFVEENFEIPASPENNFRTEPNEDVKTHINKLWEVLKRNPGNAIDGSSLLTVPNQYIVPAGRFSEMYYWQSYFIMLGLQESNRYDMIENMVNNFATLINQYGHIPPGNRTYYLSRSQPPFFAMMVELLAEKKGNIVYAQYQKMLQKEYDYFTDKAAPTKHSVKMDDGSLLTRYWDQDARPRQEAFFEDSSLAIPFTGNRKMFYKNLRSGAESGWDFSTRWFADGISLGTIQTTNYVPVDLNGLIYHLELSLSKAYRETGNLLQSNYYTQLAERRKKAINKYLYNEQDGWYYDYIISTKSLSKEITIAGFTPFFFYVAPEERITKAVAVVRSKLLQAGGVLTTLKNSGQQWDAPYGWSPLQWQTIKGLENYKQHDLAKEIATRWMQLNLKVFKATGKLMEKYDVSNVSRVSGGGEYPLQDGYGWTNGVLLKLMNMYAIKE